MTETGPTVFLMDPAHAAEKIGSVGKPQLLSRGAPRRRRWPRRARTASGASSCSAAPASRPATSTTRRRRRPPSTRDGWLRSGDVAPARCATATTTSSTASRTCSSPAARTSIRPRSRRVLTNHPAVLEAAVLGVRGRALGRGRPRRRPPAPRRRRCEAEDAARLRAHAARRLQGAQARHRRRRLPPHRRRQGAEACAAQDARVTWRLCLPLRRRHRLRREEGGGRCVRGLDRPSPTAPRSRQPGQAAGRTWWG